MMMAMRRCAHCEHSKTLPCPLQYTGMAKSHLILSQCLWCPDCLKNASDPSPPISKHLHCAFIQCTQSGREDSKQPGQAMHLEELYTQLGG